MEIPRVHLNGTGRGALLEQFEAADRELSRALEALSRSAPNARDYYVIDPGAFGRARDEHEDRMARVRAVKEEISALAEGLFSGPNERAK